MVYFIVLQGESTMAPQAGEPQGHDRGQEVGHISLTEGQSATEIFVDSEQTLFFCL